MDQKQMLNLMIDMNKQAFENSFNAMIKFQEQIEIMSNRIIESSSWIPEDGRKAIIDWVAGCKKARDEFKQMVDDNYNKMEKFFTPSA